MLALLEIATQRAVAQDSIKYSDFLAITLTALAVLLAGVGLLIAVLAIWGYRAIIDEACKIASKAADQAIRDYMTAEQIAAKLKTLVQERVQKEADEVFEDLNMIGQAGELTNKYPEGDKGGEQK